MPNKLADLEHLVKKWYNIDVSKIDNISEYLDQVPKLYVEWKIS